MSLAFCEFGGALWLALKAIGRCIFKVGWRCDSVGKPGIEGWGGVCFGSKLPQDLVGVFFFLVNFLLSWHYSQAEILQPCTERNLCPFD